MSETAEDTLEYLERVVERLRGSSARSSGDRIRVTHDTPSHTSIHIPSERDELKRRRQKYGDYEEEVTV